MNIGDKFIVCDSAPYTVFGRPQTPAKFITLEIVEEKVGKGEFTGKERRGFLAKGSDGHMYGYNYPTVSEGFGDVPWIRYLPDDEFARLTDAEKRDFVKDWMWYDITNFQCPTKTAFVEEHDFIDFCEVHQKHVYTRRGCLYCQHDLPRPNVIMNLEEHKWCGWY